MLKNERDEIDDLLRSKLYDLEVEAPIGLWNDISSQLTKQEKRPVRSRAMYLAVAASLLLAVGVSTLFFLKDKYVNDEIVPLVADVIDCHSEENAPVATETNSKSFKNTTTNNTNADDIVAISTSRRLLDDLNVLSTAQADYTISETDESPETNARPSVVTKSVNDKEISEEANISDGNAKGVPSYASVTNHSKKEKRKRWSFGTGFGSLSASAGNSVNSYLYKNTNFSDVSLISFNSLSQGNNLPKTNIKHKIPISFGLGASYALTDRWSINTGLKYSYLVSEWKTNGRYRSETTQKLHFLGVPVSLSYKIAEWSNFKLYASAGGTAEVNVSGKLENTIKDGSSKINKETEKERTGRPQFSVNSNLGVLYPVARFISAFAEVGIEKYFSDGSGIETIRTEKPVNVGMQLGLRLGL
jgi:hypothetical protein